MCLRHQTWTWTVCVACVATLRLSGQKTSPEAGPMTRLKGQQLLWRTLHLQNIAGMLMPCSCQFVAAVGSCSLPLSCMLMPGNRAGMSRSQSSSAMISNQTGACPAGCCSSACDPTPTPQQQWVRFLACSLKVGPCLKGLQGTGKLP